MAATSTSSGTVQKALHVLDIVADFKRPVRLNEIVSVSPYPKGTLYRMLQTLRTEGLLAYDEYSNEYSLGMRLVRLAHSAWSQFSLAPIARAHIDGLSESIDETIHLAQLEASQVLYVDKRNAKRPVQMYSQAGKIGPAYCTGVGKAMLAFLPEAHLESILAQQSYHAFTQKTLDSKTALLSALEQIKSQGFAFDDEEHEPGIICVATPILTSSNSVVGAISVTATTARTTLENLKSYVPKMQETANNIAQSAEHWRSPAEH